jgi:hypothetical protein
MFTRLQQWTNQFRFINGAALVFLCSIFLLSTACNSGKGAVSPKIDGTTQVVKGKLQKISLLEGNMTIAPPNGQAVTLKFTPQTPVKGGVLKDIHKNDPVQVIYNYTGEQNNAHSIEILPQGSCGG